MNDQDKSFDFSSQKKTQTAGFVDVFIHVENRSGKIVTGGIVGLQDGETGDNQYANFGQIRAHGGSDERVANMRAFPDTIVVQFNAEDGSEWKGIRHSKDRHQVNINIHLND